MKCPFCGFQESKVVDSRHSDDSLSIRRRRECLNCQRRFTTYEIVESLPVVVVKKDGSRQAFDRNKILTGLVRSCANQFVVPLQDQNVLNSCVPGSDSGSQTGGTAADDNEIVFSHDSPSLRSGPCWCRR